MNDFAIRAENLGKRYRIGGAPQQEDGRGSRLRKATAPFSYLVSTLRKARPDEIIWALQDVSFGVQQGEVIGIIGPNGAGKSTLLKILSRITQPTSGRALLRGRVGSLLEVGTGFHPELTGRENIYLNGAVLGMRRAEIDGKFDEIVAFSGVEKFLDTPVKRYSSGMSVRLAFSVAAHLQPEVLLIDEVLAVGDAAFQKKCLGKMGDVAREGRTVLFVSHNMVAMQNLCERAIWLHDGQLIQDGPSSQVISAYLSASSTAVTEAVWPDKAIAPGNEKVRLHRVCVRPLDGSPSDPITMETTAVVEVEYWNLVPGARLHITLHVYTEEQVIAFTTASNETDPITRNNPLPAGLLRSVCQIPGSLLNAGMYRILLLVNENSMRIIYRLRDALSFDVHEMAERPGAWYGKEPGAVRPRLVWHTELPKELAVVSGKVLP